MFYEHNMTEEELEQFIYNNDEVIVLDFYAKWCQPCKVLASQIETTTIPHNIKVLKVDIEDNESITKLYGVRSVPTLIMLEEDCASARLSGTTDIKAVIEWINNNV